MVHHNNRLKKDALCLALKNELEGSTWCDFLSLHLPVSAFPRGRQYSLSPLLVTMLAVRVYY